MFDFSEESKHNSSYNEGENEHQLNPKPELEWKFLKAQIWGVTIYFEHPVLAHVGDRDYRPQDE